MKLRGCIRKEVCARAQSEVDKMKWANGLSVQSHWRLTLLSHSRERTCGHHVASRLPAPTVCWCPTFTATGREDGVCVLPPIQASKLMSHWWNSFTSRVFFLDRAVCESTARSNKRYDSFTQLSDMRWLITACIHALDHRSSSTKCDHKGFYVWT